MIKRNFIVLLLLFFPYNESYGKDKIIATTSSPPEYLKNDLYNFKNNIEEVIFDKVLDLNLLYGLNQQKSIIHENTKNFLEGLSYNHGLLWGVRGSGKSSLIRGIDKHPFRLYLDQGHYQVAFCDLDWMP